MLIFVFTLVWINYVHISCRNAMDIWRLKASMNFEGAWTVGGLESLRCMFGQVHVWPYSMSLRFMNVSIHVWCAISSFSKVTIRPKDTHTCMKIAWPISFPMTLLNSFTPMFTWQDYSVHLVHTRRLFNIRFSHPWWPFGVSTINSCFLAKHCFI